MTSDRCGKETTQAIYVKLHKSVVELRLRRDSGTVRPYWGRRTMDTEEIELHFEFEDAGRQTSK